MSPRRRREKDIVLKEMYPGLVLLRWGYFFIFKHPGSGQNPLPATKAAERPISIVCVIFEHFLFFWRVNIRVMWGEGGRLQDLFRIKRDLWVWIVCGFGVDCLSFFYHNGHNVFFTEGTMAFAWKRILRDLPFKGHRGAPAVRESKRR